MPNQLSLERVFDSPQKKLALFQNLLVLAAADGVLDERESQLLLTIGNQLGLVPKRSIRWPIIWSF